MSDPGRGGDPEAAREARTALRTARARSQDGGDRFVDVYVWLFTLALLTTWVLSFARETFTSSVCRLDVGGCVLQEHPGSVAVALGLLAAGGVLAAAGAAGPVSVDRAVVRWLLGTTADRGVLLRGGLVAAVVTWSVAGGVTGMLTAVAGSAGSVAEQVLALGAALGAGLGAAVPLLLVRAQAGDPGASRDPGATAGRVVAALGLLLLGWVVLDGPLPGGPLPGGAGPGGLPPGLLVGAGVLVVVVLAVLTVPAVRCLAEVSDVQLVRGREVVDAVVGSTLMLDSSLVTGLQRRRQDRRRGRFRSAPWRLRGAAGYLAADLRMVRRRWRGVVAPVLVLPVMLVAGEGLGYGAGVVLTALLAASTAKRAGQGLRTWVASPGLRRMATVRTEVVTGLLGVVPCAAAALVAVPALLALGGPWWGGLHLALAGLAATLRAAEPAPLELGAVVSTPAGALPTGLMVGAVRGPDLALVLALVLLLRAEPWVLVSAVAAVAWQAGKDR